MEEDGCSLLDRPLLQAAPLKHALIQQEAPLDCWGRPARNGSSLGGWKAAMFLLGANSLQSLATSGCTVNLVIFLVRVLQQDNASAANAITNWIGTTFITSFIGGSLGDAYLGRLWTSILCQILYVAGLVLFAISGSMITRQAMEPCMNVPNCEPNLPSSSQVSLFYIALYMMGLATASLTPNVVSLGADQFDSPKQKSTFITLHMASASVGMVLSTSVICYVQNEGHWVMGFWISAWAGILGFLLFLAGMPSTRQLSPGKNPLFRIAHVLLAAVCNREAKIPPKSLTMDTDASHNTPRIDIQRSPSLRWLDKAAASGTLSERARGGREWGSVCTVEQVEEVKSVCRLVPFWVCGILVSSVMAQKGTLFVLQAATMDNRVVGTLEFPPSSMGLFSLTTVVLGAPLYSLVIAPWILRCRRHKKEVSSIERMGGGLVIAIASIFVAAVVESQRLKIAHQRTDTRFADGKAALSEQMVPMSIFWLIPQYVLEGFTTVFFACGHLDFNYTYSPQAMRSLATAISLSGFALGNYLSSFLVQIVTTSTTWIPNNLNEGHLDYFYWLLDGLLLLNLALFVAFSKWHSRQTLPSEELNLCADNYACDDDEENLERVVGCYNNED